MTRAAEWKLISKDSDKTILKMENTTVFFVCFESSDGHSQQNLYEYYYVYNSKKKNFFFYQVCKQNHITMCHELKLQFDLFTATVTEM